MSRNTVQLTWEPPENDGGTPITGYLIEKREVSRKTWTKVCSIFKTTMHVHFCMFSCWRSPEIFCCREGEKMCLDLELLLFLGCWECPWSRVHGTRSHSRKRIFVQGFSMQQMWARRTCLHWWTCQHVSTCKWVFWMFNYPHWFYISGVFMSRLCIVAHYFTMSCTKPSLIKNRALWFLPNGQVSSCHISH